MSIMKFRVWDKQDNHMHYMPAAELYENFVLRADGKLCLYAPSENGDIPEADANRYEVSFSTGLYDCEGREIWEADVLMKKLDNGAGGYYSVYSIEWKDGGYCLPPANYNLSDIVGNLSYNFKVIGNRFANPELLEIK